MTFSDYFLIPSSKENDLIYLLITDGKKNRTQIVISAVVSIVT